MSKLKPLTFAKKQAVGFSLALQSCVLLNSTSLEFLSALDPFSSSTAILWNLYGLIPCTRAVKALWNLLQFYYIIAELS